MEIRFFFLKLLWLILVSFEQHFVLIYLPFLIQMTLWQTRSTGWRPWFPMLLASEKKCKLWNCMSKYKRKKISQKNSNIDKNIFVEYT